MKKFFLSTMFLLLSVLPAQLAAAQGYNPYYSYSPYGYGTPYGDPRDYDPYYDLHTEHYQLYLNPYGFYPYCCAPAIIAPLTPPPVIINPRPRPGVPRGRR